MRGQRCVGRTPEARNNLMTTKSARWVRLAAAALLVLLASPAPARADAVSMQARRDFPVGSVSINVALGDFNGDGVADLAVTNYLAGTVSVLLGNGDGTYRPALSVPVGANPWAIAVGDFNSDHILDLAVTNYGSSTISVLLGNGDGTFRAAAPVAVDTPTSVAVGDFNGDGKSDLVVTNYGSSTVSVLLGNGDGTFRAASPIAVGCPIWPWPITEPAPSRSYWATAMGRSEPRRVSRPVAVRIPSPWATSIATASPIWRWPTGALTRSPCCWATATGASGRR